MDRNNSDTHALNQEIEEEEHKNFLSVKSAFKYYRTFSMNRINETEKYLNTLPQYHQDLLCRYRDHLFRIRKCIDENYKIIKKVLKDVDTLFINSTETTMIQSQDHVSETRNQDLESVQVTLKQFARDWSTSGEEERNQCYKPIIDAILKFYNPDEIDVSNVKVLVPGAGLGRLTYELAYKGYYCEGNEYSLFMLIASNFVLNRCVVENQYTIYPWIHQTTNNLTRADQVNPILFPDISPTQAPPKGTFNMVAGDFLQVYKEPEFWDCVATCFFIDCANNVVEFIENIYKILKPGAIWVNLGPLLYHFSGVENEGSIEPTYEDLEMIIKKVGFEFISNKTCVRTKYAQNPNSMQQQEYLSVFFVCKKPISTNNDYNTNNYL